jgi:hypothetical protein
LINFLRKIRNTWIRISELERKVYDIEKHIVDEKAQKVQNTLTPPPVTLSEDGGEVWFMINKEADIESRR